MASASPVRFSDPILRSGARSGEGGQMARRRDAAQYVDRLLACALLIILGPILAVAAISVVLLSRRTPFIAHRRVGHYGGEFWMLKVRSMWDRAHTPPWPAAWRAWQWIEYLPESHVPVFKGPNDPRVTSPVARFYRRFSIDELPQLLHVVTGRMRLVGPRPITFAEWDRYYGERAEEVLKAAPGITGLWQVLGRNRLTYAQRRRLDVFYANRRCAGLDWMILARTPARVLSGRDAG